uniref:hypothetical protein n=1 Tax=uncultured Maribacter sp. TaxID=431308 RepID=UPI00261F9034
GTATISVTTQDGNHIATSIITVQAAAIITFDPSTGVYTAPAGSIVTVELQSFGAGKGRATISAGAFLMLNTIWNVGDTTSFFDSDDGTFVMPPSGVVTFTGNHLDIISNSTSTVQISNSLQTTNISFTMDANQGMPQ